MRLFGLQPERLENRVAMRPIHPAIMIGGSGTRLWPLSRENKPKQFLSLVGPQSLFQDTIMRFRHPGFAAPWLLSNAETLDHALAQLAETGDQAAGLVVEPLMRGTAAALAAVALVIGHDEPDTLILAAPSDHVIERPERFRDAVERARRAAEDGAIVTFGIVPTAPETGFGYIRPGSALDGSQAFAIPPGGFVEKPSLERAGELIAAGCLWNAGIFLFKAGSFVAEMERHAPATLQAVRAAVAAASLKNGNRWILDEAAFAEAPRELSVDHAVMEKTDRAAVVPCEGVGWSDVGALSALWEIGAKDENNNVSRGNTLCLDSRNSLILAGGGRKVVAAGLTDLMVVDTPDCVLVMPRDRAQDVRTIVRALKEQGAKETNTTREARLPQGTVTLTEATAGHAVLRIDLRADARLDQRTAHGDESWTLVSGTIEARRNNEVLTLGPGQSLRVARGERIAMAAGAEPSCAVVIVLGPLERPLETLFAPDQA